MNVLVCVKRVPITGGRITLTADHQDIDTRHLGFTISPHEECGVEEAVRLVERSGGASVVMTLGPESAIEQLRDAMALGIDRGVLLETDGAEWDPQATASAIVDAVRRLRDEAGSAFDLLLFGNEAADSGDFQVGVRVAVALGLPFLTGVKELSVGDGSAVARRQIGGEWESFELPLPAVLTVREGLNLPRYPSIPGRLRAAKKPLDRWMPEARPGGLSKVRLRLPPDAGKDVRILGHGSEAAGAAVAVMRDIGVLAR